MTVRFAAVVAVGLIVGGWTQAGTVIRPAFDSPARLADWTLDGTGEWEVKNGLLALIKAGVPAGPIRRPAGLAILKSDPLGKLTFDVDLRSEESEDLLVRDVQVIVGWQSPSRFYYVHLAAKTDAVHNGIFIVADADRKRLDEPTSVPQLKDKAWHHVHLERDPSIGRIAVFVDHSATPALQATDTTLQSGRVGLGSFDETGQFKNVVVQGF